MWVATIEGHRYDREDLLRSFPDLVKRTVRGQSDADETWYVSWPKLEACPDATAAHEEAASRVRRMNTSLALSGGEARPVRFNGVAIYDPSTGGLEVSDGVMEALELRDRVQIVGEVFGADGATLPIEPTRAERIEEFWSKRPDFDVDVAKALERGCSWTALSVVREHIMVEICGKKGKDGNGAILSEGWATDDEMTRFWNTASNERHPEKMPATMDLDEARELIQRLLHKMLRKLVP